MIQASNCPVRMYSIRIFDIAIIFWTLLLRGEGYQFPSIYLLFFRYTHYLATAFRCLFDCTNGFNQTSFVMI